MSSQPSPPFADEKVEAAFDAFPKPERQRLLELRALIFETAESTDGVGALQETLKWGQPAYLTPETKSGSTIRLGVPKDGGFALFAHCQTSIIGDFQALFPVEFTYDGNRAVRFATGEVPPADALKLLIKSALTYKMKRKG